MNNIQISKLLSQITYKPNWNIILGGDLDRLFIQLKVTDSIDSVTKQPCDWKSGKRYISEFMCRQEIIGVVYSLIESAEIHEMREWFRYKGASIYNPHLDPDVLVKVANKASSFNCRVNAMSMEED